LRRVLCNLFFHPDEPLEPVAIDHPLTAGDILPIAGGIEVFYTPEHCAGQVALLWHSGRMLFAGDVCMNIMGLGDPAGFESLEEGVASEKLPVFHSMLPGSVMAILSTTMRRRVSK
jgi:glyoxylase-like metal-dependent hydrolase (beta-lactamase superfamily II)